MRLKYLSFLLLFGNIYSSKAQQVDLGVVTSAYLSDIHINYNFDIYKKIWTFNYGLVSQFHFKKLSFSNNICHLTHGANMPYSTSASPMGGIGTSTIYIRIKSYSLQLQTDYNFISKNTVKIFAGIGIYNSYVYYQKMYDPLAKYSQPNPNIIHANLPPEFSELNLVNNFSFLASTSCGISKQFKSKTIITIRPGFLYQLRQNLPSATHGFTPRIYSYTFDFVITSRVFDREKN
jgi:hypothetical protein